MQAVQFFPDGGWSVVEKQRYQEILERTDCVYVFPKGDYDEFLRTASAVRCHNAKHPDRGLAQYLLPKEKTRRGGAEAIFADFSNPGRLRQSVGVLLEEAHNRECLCFLVIGVSGDIFRQLLDGGGEALDRQEKIVTDIGELPMTAEAEALLKLAEGKFHGKSDEAKRVRRQVVEAAASSLPVMILGETGTGKEVVARFIHDNGRPETNFIAVNCGAIPRELVEKELFGSEPFAFSGAGSKVQQGLWELADGGTLFLDEIGELSLEAQAKILRALENKTIRRVGGIVDIPVDPRIIVATHRDLLQMVENGTFRKDLYYRLRLFVIRTPAITENEQQLEQEIREFWADVSDNKGPELSKQVLKMLARRSWVGNYRDLKNFLSALWDLVERRRETAVLPVHVRVIEENYGPSPKATRDGEAGLVDAEVRRMRYQQHHAMCAEALRSLQMTLDPAVKRGGCLPEDLQMRLRNGAAELTLLLNKPHRFYDAPTFHAIDNAREAVEALLQALPNGEAKVRATAKRCTLPKINEALDATFRGA